MNYHISDTEGCQILYFTTCSCLNEDRGVVWIGGGEENPNIFWTDFKTGEKHQISDNHEGVMKSYVYFNGFVNRGICKSSISFDNIHEKVYYLQGRDICCADLDGNIRVLNQIPEDQVTAFTHISRDGKRFCIPTTDMRALEYPREEGQPFDFWKGYDIDRRCRDEDLSSYLRVYDTETGEEILCEKVPKCWITHVSFNPVNPEIIMYNNEWCEFAGLRRMWLWDGKNHIAIRSMEDGRTLHDWVCHEMWSMDGNYVYYHGGFANDGPKFLGRYSLADKSIVEVPFDKHYTGYGHFNNSSRGLFVCDGYYEHPDYNSEDYNGRWISFQKVDWDKKTITWYPMEVHDSQMNHQDNHPHPTFNPEGTRAYYTSTRSGKREIYSVAVPEELL